MKGIVKKICIVTTRHISYNPRVLKEADAFFANGYDVTVVTVNNNACQHLFDKELMQDRKWNLKTINFRREEKTEKKYWLYLSLRQKLFSVMAKMSFSLGLAERAALKGYDALTKLAIQQRADFYIAHHAEALGAAYKAAKVSSTGFGFDAEDFHSGMNESKNASADDAMISYLEAKYLPHCSYLTAASKGIGEAYAKKYNLPLANIILNVFPREAVSPKYGHRPVRFYWYSQVIGQNRSLETLLEASSKIQQPFEIHLRGSFQSEAYQKKLEDLIQTFNLTSKVFFHKPILAEHIIKDAVRYDVGLALESDISINRNICVTNKIFSYLMSGLAIVGTDTYGQMDIFEQFNEAVCLCRKNDPSDLARAMLHFIQHPDKLNMAKRSARKAAEERFNWEVESERLIAGFESKLNQTRKERSFAARNNNSIPKTNV